MAYNIFARDRVDDTPMHSLGRLVFDNDGKGYRYVQAEGALSVGQVVTIDRAGQADPVTTGVAAAHGGLAVGVVTTACADDKYCEVQVFGPCAAINVGAGVTTGAALYTTTTSGRLDDTSSAGFVRGIMVDARASAGNTTGALNFPTLDRV